MNTPICDFVRRYAESGSLRFHMPGHKGRDTFGGIFPAAALDITEITGADVLYASDGIIGESEWNAASLFGSARTLFSTEGSSLCVRAMLYLAVLHAKLQGRSPRITAARNAHRVFLEAAALLDCEVLWFGSCAGLLEVRPDPDELQSLFASEDTLPTAVYVTDPDYLGNSVDLTALAEVCHRHGALLLVDSAHGAYRKFLPDSRHPLDRGADLCCDSAHKTLPVLTGGAYLHASKTCPPDLLPLMERAMSLFASTSPSWLILQSLDAANSLLAGDYPSRIRDTAARLDRVKRLLQADGWKLAGDEELKLTLRSKERGWTGTELEAWLVERGMVPEFSDPDYLVLMLTPENTPGEMDTLCDALRSVPLRPVVKDGPPPVGRPHPVLSLREALFAPFERVSVDRCLGRVLASPSVSCPPAVPICVCGERIDEDAMRLFLYYGVAACEVVKE